MYLMQRIRCNKSELLTPRVEEFGASLLCTRAGSPSLGGVDAAQCAQESSQAHHHSPPFFFGKSNS